MAPGVVVSTIARGGGSTALTENSGQFFVAGMAQRGPTGTAVLVRGIADFEGVYGDRTAYSYLHDTVKTFFEEGGEQAYISRVVGPAATSGFVVVRDRAGSPTDTLRFEAASAGAWSSDLKVVVSDGNTAGTVRVIVNLGTQQVESFNNLASPAAVASAFQDSLFVKVTDLGSVSAAPQNLPAVGTYSITAGVDDRAAVTAAQYATALDAFVLGYGSGAVSIPGMGVAVHTALIDHARENRRIALLSHDVTASIAELSSVAGNLNSDAAGLFAPWVRVSDGAGGTRPIPPEGFAAGARARAHQQFGAWRVPAGAVAISSSLSGTEVEYTGAEANRLDEAKVSVIRRISNTTRLYGWRSLSQDVSNFGYLNGRDLLNYLTVRAEAELEQFVFAPVDGKGQLLAQMEGVLTGIVEPIRNAGGLYENYDDAGELIDPGYLIETGSSINSTASLARNEVKARMSVRVSPNAALVNLTIVKVGVLAGF